MRDNIKFKSCIVCATQFEVFHKLQTRCKPCQARYKQTRQKLFTIPCAKCGAEFHPVQKSKQKHCPDCRSKFTCVICNTTKPRTALYQLYCSDKCSFLAKQMAKHGDKNYLEALKRDGFKCVKCGNNKSPHVHHIDNNGTGKEMNQRNNSLENLVTLCNPCHMKVHAITNRTLHERHPDTVLEVFNQFIHCSN